MLVRLVAFVIPLGLDTFAVSTAIGLAGLTGRARFRVATLMAAFEAGMPLVGLLLGHPLGHALGGTADYLAIGVLVAFGIWMAFHEDDEEARISQMARMNGFGMLALGVSVSLDELAIGFTLGLMKIPVIPALLAIAAQAFLLSQLGVRLGGRVSERFTESAEKLAGVVLAGLGLFLLFEKLR